VLPRRPHGLPYTLHSLRQRGDRCLEYGPAVDQQPPGSRSEVPAHLGERVPAPPGYLSETNTLLNSRSHRTELATTAHTSQSVKLRPTVPNAGCRNGA
jgi:hypothetical protein